MDVGSYNMVLFNVFRDAALPMPMYDVYVQEVWKCAVLSFNNQLFFKGITVF